MDYLFFDTECADGNRLCSFGYVLCDRDFNIVEKRDILINPECSFRLGRGDEQWITLSYPEEEFKKAQNFAAQYELLKNILCAPNRVLFGHGISADLGFFERATLRYRKPKLDLAVFDTQILYSLAYNDPQTRGLDYIVDSVGADRSQLTEHKSCDDAHMSMLCAAAVAKTLGCGIDGLTKMRSAAVKSDSLILGRAVKEVRRRYPKLKKAKQVCISDALQYANYEGRINFICLLAYRGYGYTNTVSKAEYYVTYGEDCLKERAYRSSGNVTAVTPEQMGKILNANVNEHCETYDKFPQAAALTVQEIFAEAINSKPHKKVIRNAECVIRN